MIGWAARAIRLSAMRYARIAGTCANYVQGGGSGEVLMAGRTWSGCDIRQARPMNALLRSMMGSASKSETPSGSAAGEGGGMAEAVAVVFDVE
jgi:hypothetical protein